MSKPIKKLEEATKELEKGNFETTINFKSNDELGLLSDSFNKMTNKIKESNNKIKKDQENLEKRIKERTKELEEINKELEKFNKLSTGRELEMIKLKKELAELKK
ncbi:MAG: HAMP domain-containing protein [Candidatus Pacearchaeota archaeon]